MCSHCVTSRRNVHGRDQNNRNNKNPRLTLREKSVRVGESDSVNGAVARTILPWQLYGMLVSTFLGVVVLTNRSLRNGARVVARGQFSWANNGHSSRVFFILRDIWRSDILRSPTNKATEHTHAHTKYTRRLARKNRREKSWMTRIDLARRNGNPKDSYPGRRRVKSGDSYSFQG